ncbi:MAG: cell division protein FtsZ [Paludibacteraceae bacterium]|nr:cell division protein FtsZ [Paludibacteraceae bacterium]
MDEINHLDFQMEEPTKKIIKVIGVGGGGGNAVKNMYQTGITDVTFALCNTDRAALNSSGIPVCVQLGEGLGAGNQPKKGRNFALMSEDKIREMLSDGTQMVFITATMGGGTGTGAGPVVAKVAHELGLLTIGVVTIPFDWEMGKKQVQAMKGVVRMSKYVDAILLINNSKLIQAYPEFDLRQAFKAADNVLAQAVKGIAEIITVEGYINVDFADVCTIMRNGGVAVMNTGSGTGEGRVTKALEAALNSPLLNNNDICNASRVLVNVYTDEDKPISLTEIGEIKNFSAKMKGDVEEYIWGVTYVKDLGDEVKTTIVATGPNMKFATDSLKIQLEEEIIAEDKVWDEELNKMKGISEEATAAQPTETQLGVRVAVRTNPHDLEHKIQKEMYVNVENLEEKKATIQLYSLDELDNEAVMKQVRDIPAIERYK